MGLRKKLIQGMRSYVENSMLPVCYAVAVRHGFVGDQDDFNREVLAYMKGEEYSGAQECSFYVPTSSEEAQ